MTRKVRMQKLRTLIKALNDAILRRLLKPQGEGSGAIEAGPPRDGIAYWRERILSTILAAGTALSLFALIPAVHMVWTEKRWLLLIADLAALVLTGGLILFRRFGLRLRAAALLLIVFLVGLVIIMELGFRSGGPAWLFFFAVLSGVLLGLRAALIAAALNAAALLVLAALLNNGISAAQGLGIPFQRAIVAWANFVMLNAVSAVSVATLVNGLQALNRRLLQAGSALEAERAELLKAKDELKREITVRSDSEKALWRSERKYRLLTESIKEIIWTMDTDLRFTYVSPAVAAIQGWSAQEYLDLDLKDIMTPASLDKVMEEHARQIALSEKTGSFERSSTLELELRRKGGSTVWAEVTASFLLGEDNRPVGILGVTRDITERRRAAKEREQLIESLERAKKMEALGTLAGGVAHDLNNVLSGIVSYPDLLLWDLPQGNPLRKTIETIRDSGKKAAAIVQDLLTLARRGVSQTEILLLNDLIAAQLESPELRRMLSFHPLVEVKTIPAPGLLNIMGSSVHLSKTIMNLLSNAAEAMPEGGFISIATENVYLERPIRGYAEIAEGSYVHLRVSDSGVGISNEDRQRIFEPFYTKKKMGRSGTGLGMAVVWGTVQDHHGYIDVRSTQGAGTTIDLYFPATSLEAPPLENTDAPELLKGRGEKILIVDDVREQREILGRILSQLGYDHTAAASGEKAVEYLATHTADLVILDMIMDPGIDGLETYQRILRRHPQQKAIITSGFAETERVKRAQAFGTGAYVKKPYLVEELAKVLRAELERPAPPV
jgi:PAS domain S-box-containing protein